MLKFLNIKTLEIILKLKITKLKILYVKSNKNDRF
jgi:hypothetical protein